MIIPRKPVLYKYLKELVNDSFSIHTRSRRIHNIDSISKLVQHNNELIRFHEGNNSHPHFRRYTLLMEKIYMEWNIDHLSEVDANYKSIVSHANVDLINLLRNSTSLLSHSAIFFTNLAKQIKHGNPLDKLYYEDKFFVTELEQLFSLLRKCNGKTALVLPSYLCLEFMKQFDEEGHKYGSFYLGLETYYELNVAFVMKGRIPKYLSQRVKYAERCGVWKRWQSLFKARYLRKSESMAEPVRKPTMGGNIAVIFILLLFGISLSLICLCTEFCTKHC